MASAADLESPFQRFWRRLAGMDAPHHLYHPVGVAVSPDGDFLAVTDQGLAELFLFDFTGGKTVVVPKEEIGGVPVGVALYQQFVWVVVSDHKRILVFGRDGKPRGSISLEDCERPTGLAIDEANGLFYVTDASSTEGEGHAVHVHQMDGTHRAQLGKKGSGDGELFFPTFVTVAPNGGVYVADTMNARVQELSATGELVRQFGERGDRFGQFDKPKGVATDSFGNLYVVDSFFSVVQIFNSEAKLLLFFGGRGDSPGFLSNPSGIAIDSKNRIYVTNGLNFRVDVYELINTQAADSFVQEAPAGGTH